MLTFKLISIVDGFYHYEVYPEDKKELKGSITFNPETKEIKEKVPTKIYFNYLAKATGYLTDENGKFKESGMVAWG